MQLSNTSILQNRSNIKYHGWDANGLKEFSKIVSLIKSQCSEQYSNRWNKITKIMSKKLNHMYGIITDTPSENTELYIAYNDLSSDEDEPGSTAQN